MWPNPQFPADLVTFTGEILNSKRHFLCSEEWKLWRGLNAIIFNKVGVKRQQNLIFGTVLLTLFSKADEESGHFSSYGC